MESGERWAELKAAFATISESSPSERQAHLAAVGARDPELAARLRELLDADARAESVLEPFDLAPGPSTHDSLGADTPVADSLSSDPFGYAGQIVSPYRVHEVIGSGGMGVVYRAEDTRLGRSVALKFLLPQYSLDPAAKERFLQEARAASTLDHPNVCTVYGVGETDRGDLFLAMACYEGETLKQRLARSTPSTPEAIAIARQILLGVGAAHAAGIVHRDLKPGNVMLAPDGTAKILDFGLAKVSDLTLTGPGLRPGTVAYMSPEQVEGLTVDRRSDLWSLGVVLYEMLAGQRPFGGGHDLSTVYAILHDEPAPPSRVRAGSSSAYDDIVSRLLCKDRDRRYATAGDVIHDLDAVSSGAPISAAPPTPAARWSRRSVLTLGTAGVVAIVAVVAILPALRGDERQGVSPAAIVASDGAQVDERSIAVLPFVDMSPAGDQAYFSDGITEEILNALARVPELRVPARTSSFAFKGRNVPVRDIARQLGVAVLLEGSVRKDGDRVRITAQLIDASADRHLWSETFDRNLDDVFAVQTEIARTVTEALKVRLADRTRAAAVPNARAHDLYLQGRFYWNRRSTDDVRRAIELFEDATRADSTYAPAYAGLAMAYAIPGFVTAAPTEATFAKAEEAAARAIALDSSLAEAYAALGYAHHWQWRWAEADQALRRATELDPANTTARQWYGEHLAKMGRGREAEAELRRAVVLDPLSPIANHNLALVLLLAGRHPDAIAQLERTSRMDPSLSIPQLLLHRTYAMSGQVEQSEAAGRRFAELQGLPNANDYVTLARGARSSPDRTAAVAVLDRWERSRQPHWPEIAMYYAMLGEREKAIAALERGFRARAPMMTGLKVAPWLDPLRADPRFERMIRAMQFP